MESSANTKLSGVKIHLLGSASLKKQLTCFYLHKETAAECVLIDDCDSLRTPDQAQAKGKSIVLWDVFSMNPKKLRKETIIASLGQRDLFRQFSVALFDLEPEFALEGLALQLGVKGFFYRGDSPQQLVRGLGHICNGNVWVSPKIIQDCLFGTAKTAPKPAGLMSLTRREEDVLRLMTHGYRNAEIAEQLTLSPNTVKAHLYQAFKKIKVSSRMMAAQWVEHNL
jgi:LuxR family transcriptional regulator of csgAB operon